MDSAPLDATHLATTAQQVISTADMVAVITAIIFAISVGCSIWNSRKKRNDAKIQLDLDTKFYNLRKEELRFDKIKFKEERK